MRRNKRNRGGRRAIPEDILGNFEGEEKRSKQEIVQISRRKKQAEIGKRSP
jgi:hypothetical protein